MISFVGIGYPMLLKCCEDFKYFSPDSSLQRLMVRKPMRVYLIYGSGGGGHKASANALMDVLLVGRLFGWAVWAECPSC